MSKHIFHQTLEGTKYEIQIGWDRPLRQYYGLILAWVVDDDVPEDGGYYDDLVWSNMYQPAVTHLLDGIAQEITQRGFIIPDGLLNNVRQDRQNNRTNGWQFYDTTAPQNVQSLLTPGM